MKKKFSTRRKIMTNKFWKFVTEDGCSPRVYDSIKYIPGETIEIKDADPDKTLQCSSGIHCLYFSDEQYNEYNVLFGPKVAILEVNEEDIIFYENNGKCRVRKAKVLEVKEPEIWMRTGNGNPTWALNCVRYCGHHPDVMQVVIDSGSKEDSYWYAKDILKGHDYRLMQVFIDDQNPLWAYYYALNILKGHDERLMQIIIDEQNAHYAYYYAYYIIKGHNEKLMEIVNNDYYYKILYEKDILNKEKNND